MELKDKVILCLLLSGFFSRPKLERVTSRKIEELFEAFPELVNLQDFNLARNREASLKMLEACRGFVCPPLLEFIDAFLGSSHYTPSELLNERLASIGPKLTSKVLDISHFKLFKE